MLANLILAGGAVTFATTLLDFLLSDKQKARLTDWSFSIWNWVDEAKRLSIFGHFVTPKWQRIVMLMSAAIGIPGINYLLLTRWHPNAVAVVLVAIITITSLYIDWKFFPRVVSYIAASKSMIAYTLKSFAVMLLCGFGGYAIHSVSAWLFLNLPTYIAWALVIPLGIAIMFMVFLSAQVFIIWLMSVGVAILIALAYVVLYPLELILRRIAEYPKGPVLALSALATAIGAFGKILAS